MAKHSTHKEHDASTGHHASGHKHKTTMKVGIIISVVLGILLLVSLFTGGFGMKIGAMSKDKAAAKAADFISANLLQDGSKATIISVTTKGDLYDAKMNIAGKQYDIYITKDGKMLMPSAIDMSADATSPAASTPQTPQNVPKSNKPVVNLFVMSYCPYGLQAQKAMIPAYELLKNVADININFVNYAMHGKQELDENLRQYCIQSEQKDKFWNYLTCFVQSDDYADCMKKANVDSAKLSSCIASTDAKFKVTELYNDRTSWQGGQFPQFNVESDLNDKYGIGGSPTLIINGAEVSADRSPEGFKKAICAGFSTQPSECETALSSAATAPGIGSLTASGSTSAASCG